MELRDLLPEIERECAAKLEAIRLIETHSRTEGDLLACLRHAYFHLRVLVGLSTRALAKNEKES